MIVLPTAYLGNIEYYAILSANRQVVIDLGEHYRKQTYRNRCQVLGANGIITLVVPTVKRSAEKVPVKEIRIDYSTRWQSLHWRSIVSAYKNSPFFDYFEDDIAPFYRRRYDGLAEFNQQLQQTVLECLGADIPVEYNETYRENVPPENDFRIRLSSKRRTENENGTFRPVPYYQVFSDRYGFVPNLSILDLLFCEGNHSLSVLRDSTVRR